MISRIIDRILCRSDFIERPPVLIDIGASGELNPKWKLLAKHSVCIAFDADEREIRHIEMEPSHFKRLHVFNAVLTNKAQGKIPFYLTNSPFCSSSLKPDNQSLEDWFFADLFEVERRVELNSIDLPQVLKKLEIAYVDRLMSELLKMSPGWAEVAFINTLQQDVLFTEREFLLGWIFATLYLQHGYALELALKAAQKYGDSIFAELARVSTKQVKDKYRILPLLKLERIGKVFLDRFCKKLLDES